MTFWMRLKEVRRYPSAVAAIVIIGLLILMSLYAVIRIPYSEAIRLWRAGEAIWLENPRNAAPKWINWFGANQPETIKLTADKAQITTESLGGGARRVTYRFTFDFFYDHFPQEIAAFFTASYQKTPPQVVLTWLTPDGREFQLGSRTVRANDRYIITGDPALARRLGPAIEEALFLLTVALLWGAPIAMIFGILAAVGISLAHFVISGVGAWFGGAVDLLVDRLTELRMILPLLPILIMVGTLWSRSLWTILWVLLAFNLIGGTKTFRAMFLQAREAPYIEAARAYGAGNFRIIFRYLLPRMIPVLVPGFVLAIPNYVFLEASLSILGLGDPLLPTWGKVIQEAYSNDALYKGMYYWLLEPAFLLMLTGLGFSMLGFTLDRIFNPRLRSL